MTIAISIQKLIFINYLEKNYQKIHSKIFCLLQKRRRNLNFIIMNLQKKPNIFSIYRLQKFILQKIWKILIFQTINLRFFFRTTIWTTKIIHVNIFTY